MRLLGEWWVKREYAGLLDESMVAGTLERGLHTTDENRVKLGVSTGPGEIQFGRRQRDPALSQNGGLGFAACRKVVRQPGEREAAPK
jgi:hypothetical protein